MDLFSEQEEKAKTWQEEWVGMPEYINEKPKEPKQIAVFKFKTDEDFDRFMEVVKRELYDDKRVFDGKQLKNKKSAWFPLPSRPSEHVYTAPQPKCYWCKKNATRNDYRDFNGQVSKVKTCEVCFNKSNEELRSNEYIPYICSD